MLKLAAAIAEIDKNWPFVLSTNNAHLGWTGFCIPFHCFFFVYPWHNVPNNYAEIEEKGIDTINRDKFIYTCFKNKPPKSMTFELVQHPGCLSYDSNIPTLATVLNSV